MTDGVLTMTALASPVHVDYIRVDKHWYRVDGNGVAEYMQRDYGVWCGCRPATEKEYHDHVARMVRYRTGEILQDSVIRWGFQ